MKVPIYSLNGEVKGSRDFARVFSEPVRADLINRAVVSEQSGCRQPYGTDPLAGKRTSAHYHGRRKVRHSMMNKEMARMARIHGTGFLHMTARFVPQATKGRKAHPPKVEKVWKKGINKKERMKALFSAVAATARRDCVSLRGHRVEGLKHVPLVVENGIEGISRAKDVNDVFGKLGLQKEMERVRKRKVRSGKGTLRGRRYKVKKGPLLVVSECRGIEKAARNIPGVDVVGVDNLMVKHLAPGGSPGRLTIWSEGALEKFEKNVVGREHQNEGGKAAFKLKQAVSPESLGE